MKQGTYIRILYGEFFLYASAGDGWVLHMPEELGLSCPPFTIPTTYKIIDEKLFMLAVIKHGIKFEEA